MSTTSIEAPEARPWLSCRGISKHYGGVQALRDADLDVYAGEVLGLIGPNGAGKSTLVKVIAAAVRRDGGSVVLDGQEIALHDPSEGQRHGLVMMPQELTVLPSSSLVDNVTLGNEIVRRGFRSPGACKARTTAALTAVGLDLDPMRTAGSLSAAQQRLVMLARALDARARLLILDEPTAGLPPNEATTVTDAVKQLRLHDVTVIYVSHHLSEIAALCERVICVREGRVVETLSGDAVTKQALVSLLLNASTDVDPAAEDERPTIPAPSDEGDDISLREVSSSRLRGVSMSASRGRVTGVTGLLGSGVADVVSQLVGIDAPAEGAIWLNGNPVSFRSPADALDAGVAYLAGDRSRSAFTTLSIRENVSVTALARWAGRFGILRPRAERNGVEKALGLLSVQGDAGRPLLALSGGNQQRALVARLIAADVQVLVLDEPTIGVDVRARRELWDAVRALAQDRIVVVASSEPEELVALADRVVCVRDGKVARVLEGRDITELAITSAIV